VPTLALKAHFDGQHILLDEPYPLPPETLLMVLVMQPAADTDRVDWTGLSASGLNQAYGADEPEYSIADVRPAA